MPVYFSGEQARVMFRGQLVDDIVTLDYVGQQQKMPLYGYKSHIWDRVVRGKFLLQGSFTIAFTEPFKLLKLLEFEKLDIGSSAGVNIDDEYIEIRGGSDKLVSNRSLEENLFEIQKTNPGYFDDVVLPTMRSSLWGKWNSAPRERRVDQHDYRDRGFLGNDDSDVFTIVIQYVGSDMMDILEGVRITNVSKILQPNGDPILEKYDFIARDMDQTTVENPSASSLPVSVGVLSDSVQSIISTDPTPEELEKTFWGEDSGIVPSEIKTLSYVQIVIDLGFGRTLYNESFPGDSSFDISKIVDDYIYEVGDFSESSAIGNFIPRGSTFGPLVRSITNDFQGMRSAIQNISGSESSSLGVIVYAVFSTGATVVLSNYTFVWRVLDDPSRTWVVYPDMIWEKV